MVGDTLFEFQKKVYDKAFITLLQNFADRGFRS